MARQKKVIRSRLFVVLAIVISLIPVLFSLMWLVETAEKSLKERSITHYQYRSRGKDFTIEYAKKLKVIEKDRSEGDNYSVWFCENLIDKGSDCDLESYYMVVDIMAFGSDKGGGCPDSMPTSGMASENRIWCLMSDFASSKYLVHPNYGIEAYISGNNLSKRGKYSTGGFLHSLGSFSFSKEDGFPVNPLVITTSPSDFNESFSFYHDADLFVSKESSTDVISFNNGFESKEEHGFGGEFRVIDSQDELSGISVCNGSAPVDYSDELVDQYLKLTNGRGFCIGKHELPNGSSRLDVMSIMTSRSGAHSVVFEGSIGSMSARFTVEDLLKILGSFK